MIVSTHQPLFCPWPGFFAKGMSCDFFVMLDNVQFPRGTTWISRNRFKNEQGVLWLTVPVWKRGKGPQKINEVKICYDQNWIKKHILTLATAYAHAPFLDDHMPFFKALYEKRPSHLIDLNMEIIAYLKKVFSCSTELVRASELGITGKGNELLIEICKKLRASTYVASVAAKKYIVEERFAEEGIKVNYLKFDHPVYPQLWGDFIYNVSAVDLLFNCGPKGYEIIIKSLKIVS